MALFKKTKKEVTKSVAVIKESKKDLSAVILRPRITEKAAVKADESNCYAFDVVAGATKTDVKSAIAQIYKVAPVKVNIINIPKKPVRTRARMALKGGGRKAYVFLKKGDKIEFV